MKDIKPPTNDQQLAVSLETRLTLNARFSPEMLVLVYKNRYSSPSHDILVRVHDCRCNRWEGGHAGHKAHEGIAKLEGNRTDWKTIHHCASCTGGGMWRVRW